MMHRLALALLIGPLALALAGCPALAEEPAPGAEGADADLAQAGDETETRSPEEIAADRMRQRLDAIERLREERKALDAEMESQTGEARAVAERRFEHRVDESIEILDGITNDLVDQEAEGIDTSQTRPVAEKLMRSVAQQLPGYVDRLVARSRELEERRDAAPSEEKAEIETRLLRPQQRADQAHETYFGHLNRMQQLGLDTTKERTDLAQRLEARAEQMAGMLEVASEALDVARTTAADKPEDRQSAESVHAVQLRLNQMSTSLSRTLDLMEHLELPVSKYREIQISSTGEWTSHVFDLDVARGLLNQWLSDATEWARENAPRISFSLLQFFAILLLFWVFSRIVRRIAERAMSSRRLALSQLARNLTLSISARAVLVLGVLVALSELGIEIVPLLAGLGVVGFIVGFALQDTLGNFASGAMILIYRPYDVGDTIEAAGVFGQVSDMSLVSTTILTFDNQTLVVPNTKIWGDVIKNVTSQDRRRVDMTFRISYADDVRQAEQVLGKIVDAQPKVLRDPEPTVKLHKLGESGVEFVVRPWVETADYWEVYWNITREVKLQFDAEGIAIGVPQRDLRIAPERPEAPA